MPPDEQLPASPFDALQMELRGYELARRTEDGWEVVNKYRPNEIARRLAIVDGRALEWRAKKEKRPEVYAVRPLVSISVDFAAGQHPELRAAEGALVSPDKLFFDEDDNPPPEESLIVKPEGTEFSGTGHKVPGAPEGVEIPYNYDQLAGAIDVPDPWGNDGKG